MGGRLSCPGHSQHSRWRLSSGEMKEPVPTSMGQEKQLIPGHLYQGWRPLPSRLRKPGPPFAHPYGNSLSAIPCRGLELGLHPGSIHTAWSVATQPISGMLLGTQACAGGRRGRGQQGEEQKMGCVHRCRWQRPGEAQAGSHESWVSVPALDCQVLGPVARAGEACFVFCELSQANTVPPLCFWKSF